MSEINEKLNKLKNQFETVPEELNDYEKRLRNAELFTYLLKFDGMKMFFDILEGKIRGINAELMENSILDDESRAVMFARKECYREVMKIFTDKEQEVQSINKRINEELKES